jgi:hypothetical protein
LIHDPNSHPLPKFGRYKMRGDLNYMHCRAQAGEIALLPRTIGEYVVGNGLGELVTEHGELMESARKPLAEHAAAGDPSEARSGTGVMKHSAKR